jgi:hypothetical protein
MLIPFGVLSAAGGGEPVAGSDYELISTTILGASASTVEFTSIPSDYKHLQVRWVAKTTTSANNIQVQFNGITAASYARHHLVGTVTTVAASNASGQTFTTLVQAASRSTTANAFTAGIMDVLDYASSSKNTTLRSLHGGQDALSGIFLASGLLNNTASISSIRFFLASSDLATNTRFSIYGIRG